jgi:hypothetical protein
MIETKTKEIDGKRVEVTPFTARIGVMIKVRWVKLIGPSLSSLISNVKDVKGKLDVNTTVLAASLSELCTSLDAATTLALIVDTMKTTRIDGHDMFSEQEFDMMFASDYLFMYKVVAYILEVNFASFFAVGGIGKLVLPKLTK